MNALESREAYVHLSPSRPTGFTRELSAHIQFSDFLGPLVHAASLTVLTLQGYTLIEEAREFHFPSLRHLILLEVTRTVPGLAILNRFPNIERLTRVATDQGQDDQTVGIDDFLTTIGPCTRDDGDSHLATSCPVPDCIPSRGHIMTAH